MGGNIVILLIMIPVSALLSGIGIYAWKRKQPMWFYSGTEVKESEIRDVRAYNRANGIMWLAYSAPFWASAAVGLKSPAAAGIVVLAGCFLGSPLLVFAWHRIYRKFQA